jgi:nucleotide-binding universal stress UspA family protein
MDTQLLPSPTTAKFQNIVALVDFSDVTARIVEHTRALALTFSSNVVLMHGVPRQPGTVDIGIASPVVMRDPNSEEMEHDKTKLLEICASLSASGINVSAAQSDQITADSIVAESKWLEADLIIVGSHHHSALHDLFLGSMTRDVLQHATCPVLVIPTPEPPEDRKPNNK